MPKNAEKYICELCDFKCSKLSNLNKHKTTRKHIYRMELNEKNVVEVVSYHCKKCNKGYKAANSLWYHEKKCKGNELLKEQYIEQKEIQENINNGDNTLNANLLMEIVKQTQEFKNLIIEQNNKINELTMQNAMIQHNITNNTTNNSFNLNVFLNEKCKDALNLMDFVNSLQLNLIDFEATGRLGFVEGISKIIVNGLKKMDVHKRPVHCTDVKRETMYIKDRNTWEKDTNDKSKLSQVVQIVAHRNMLQLKEWQQIYPECMVNNTKENEELVKIMLAVLGGRTDEENDKNTEKIRRNIAKEVAIDKTIMNM